MNRFATRVTSKIKASLNRGPVPAAEGEIAV
jgi:hypothetical protein